MLTALSRNPEAMQRVGKTAQDEIYISWKDAVTHAQARYEVVPVSYTHPCARFVAGEFLHPAHAGNAHRRRRAAEPEKICRKVRAEKAARCPIPAGLRKNAREKRGKKLRELFRQAAFFHDARDGAPQAKCAGQSQRQLHTLLRALHSSDR